MSYLKLFQLYYPNLAKAMRNCSHHYDEENLNKFHIEGDVFCHTALVVKQLEGTGLEKAAVLHDIGKTETRYENHEKKRVRFSGHEAMSAFMSLSIMNDWKLPKDERARLFKLIAMHGDPYRLTPEEINRRTTNDPILANELYLFGMADHRGRFHEDKDFKEHHNPQPEIRELEKFDKEVVFLIGLPGSGKSTYIQDNLPMHTRISRDDLVMDYGTTYNAAWKAADHKAVDALLQKCLNNASKTQNQVVIDMTNLSRKQRKAKLSLFKGFNKRAVVLLPDLLTTLDRCAARPNKYISEDVIKKMIMSFNPPGLDEFDSVDFIF